MTPAEQSTRLDRLNAIQFHYALAMGGEFLSRKPQLDASEQARPQHPEPIALINAIAPHMLYARQQVFTLMGSRRCDQLLQTIIEVALAEILDGRTFSFIVNEYMAITRSFYDDAETRLLHGVLAAAAKKLTHDRTT